MNTPESLDADLTTALQQLESALEMPLVPGELDAWLQTTHQAFEQVHERLPQHVHQQHDAMLRQMMAEDPGQAARVDQLRDVDRRLLDQLDELARLIEQVEGRAPRAEPDERLVEEPLHDLTDRGLAFILEVRKQELALRTWYREAYDRDRGTVD